MSKKNAASVKTNRRDFLGLAVAAAPAAAVTVATAGKADAKEEAPTSLGLRETEHVKKYFETARF
ncbi:MAG: twin-arginine translocation signal domain-containing protein [Pseudomonadota bacterium]